MEICNVFRKKSYKKWDERPTGFDPVAVVQLKFTINTLRSSKGLKYFTDEPLLTDNHNTDTSNNPELTQFYLSSLL